MTETQSPRAASEATWALPLLVLIPLTVIRMFADPSAAPWPVLGWFLITLAVLLLAAGGRPSSATDRNGAAHGHVPPRARRAGLANGFAAAAVNRKGDARGERSEDAEERKRGNTATLFRLPPAGGTTAPAPSGIRIADSG